MQYRLLGRSGLKVSTITLGTMTFGGVDRFAKVGNTDVKAPAVRSLLFFKTIKNNKIIGCYAFDHPFVKDYYNGITKVEAERRINEMLRTIKERDQKAIKTKPWWKLW